MAGVKGAGGPPPKRSDQRRRVNKPAKEITKAEGAVNVLVPRANAKWHPVAKRWFESLARSGQSKFYEPSDWATAELLAESMSRELRPQRVVTRYVDRVDVEYLPCTVSGAALAALLKGMTALLVTEGDRRRAALELERPKPDGAAGEGGGSVSWIDDARRRIGGAG